MTATGTEARVCQDIAQRQAKGIAKYGTTVEGNPLGMVQWIRHAYEECLDQAVYLRRCLEVLEGAQSTTLEDGSVLTASGSIQNDPHADHRLAMADPVAWLTKKNKEAAALAGVPAAAEKPWYPDDSGEWVEVPDDCMGCPVDPDAIVVTLGKSERINKHWVGTSSCPARDWCWTAIAAYKVVKP